MLCCLSICCSTRKEIGQGISQIDGPRLHENASVICVPYGSSTVVLTMLALVVFEWAYAYLCCTAFKCESSGAETHAWCVPTALGKFGSRFFSRTRCATFVIQ
jgi:hypothetical protein